MNPAVALPKLARFTLVVALCLGTGACSASQPSSTTDAPTAQQNAQAAPEPQPIIPPFAVRGELEGLLVVWFDAQGVHTAQKRADIPEPQRAAVRVESLQVAPDARLDSDHVYVADVRKAGTDGSYPVRKATRAWFDAQVDKAKPQVAADSSSDVVVYKASWCGVCKAAAKYLHSRHIDFVEKDVEKDSAANAEMLRKTSAKGLTPHGVPVIDFRGEIMLGFDQARIAALIDHYAKTI